MRPPRSRPAPLAVATVVVLLVVLAGARPSTASEPEWNIARIGAPASAAGAVIAIVDTGVDDAHPAFGDRVLPTIDVVGLGDGDDNGHGTHVAGTAAGADAGCGAIGVAPDARILPIKVLDGDGAGTLDDVAEGIRRAADAGATVINLSLGSDVVLRGLGGSGLDEAIDHAWSVGSIPVLAAGNGGIVGGLVGSGYGDLRAVVVTATDHRDRVAPYATSVGSAEWGIAAPGGDRSGQVGRDVLSAFPDDRCALHAGTSMAVPHVAGALAVLRARGLAPAEAVEHLLATARDLGAEGPDATYGHGMVDLSGALGALDPPASTTTAPAPEPPTTSTTSASTRPAPSAASQATTTTVPSPIEADAGATEPPATSTPAGESAPAGEVPTPAPPSTTGSSSPPSPATDESAPPVVAGNDRDEVPGGLVAVAAAALLAGWLGTGVAARRLIRRR